MKTKQKQMPKEKVKELIEEFEYYQNAFHKFGEGNSATAQNIRGPFREANGLFYKADIILSFPQDKKEERYFECLYPISLIESMAERRKDGS